MPERIFDVSPLVSERLAVYPGDVPYQRLVSQCLERGDALELSSLTATLHLGAHADAPSHVLPGGASIDQLSLETFMGPCQVVEAMGPGPRRLGPAVLPGAIEAPRILFKTGSADDPERLHREHASLTIPLAAELARRGTLLVGIDTPSVDPDGDEALSAHRTLARSGIAILEGLMLAHVPAGLYTLIALPLRLAGAEASPVRAVLIGRPSADFPA